MKDPALNDRNCCYKTLKKQMAV